MSDHRQALNATLAELRTERDRLDRTIELLRAAVDTLVGDPEPESSRPPAITVEAAPPAAGPIAPCPHCGKICTSNAGRASHMRNCDKRREDVPADVTPPAVGFQILKDAPPAIDGDQIIAGKFFECSDCLYRGGSVTRLARHCRTEHSRDATTAERSPVAA